jgi:N-methylhydantoinase A
VDIGGTFTDLVVLDDEGKINTFKQPSTPKEPLTGVHLCLEEAANYYSCTLREFLSRCGVFVHGTTIGTNALIQRTGPKVGLIVTKGHRDILYLRDGFKPDRFNARMKWPPEPLVPRHLTLAVEERMNYRGEEILPLNEKSVLEAIEKFRAEGVRAIAVSLLWSMKNPAHEKRVREIVEKEIPDAKILVSSDVLPMIREWERTSATVLSTYIHVLVEQYLRSLEANLASQGLRHRLLIMQMNGGCSQIEPLLKQAVYILDNGPAAGPSAAAYYARNSGLKNAIIIDMGGTSFDISILADLRPVITRRKMVAEMPVGVPAINGRSIGAGGGSIAWIDPGGKIQVGPRSAGADTGQACY